MRVVAAVTALAIFDCDGVLVDSELIAHELLAAMITELGHPMTLQESIEKFGGHNVTDTLALAEGVLGHKVPAQLGERYGRLLAERLRRDLKPIAGVGVAIAAIPCRRCVASSSSFARIRLSLEVTGLAGLFDGHVFSADQVVHGKPAPDLYLFAAKTMKADPNRCVVVEDSPLGVKAGVAAGMAVIGFTGAAHATADLAQRLSAAGARRVIAAMHELPGAVASIAA